MCLPLRYMNIHSFTFNPVAENTYILSDASGECIIVDPGCFNTTEQKQLKTYIDTNNLRPVRLLNTHCHFDHVYGNSWVAETWNLDLEIHPLEVSVLASFNTVCSMYGLPGGTQPEPKKWLQAGETILFGNTTLTILFTPGHSPGSVSFYDAASQQVIAGDVLFQGSIGRTDLPGGNFDTLAQSIRSQLYTLPDAVRVYPGHGPSTTIGYEKKNNPFVSAV